MKRRGTPEADLQRSVVQALRFALPRTAIIHHCANEVTEPGPRGAKRQAILVGMGVHSGFADLMVLCDGRVLFLELIAATLAGMPDNLGGKRMAIRVAELARAGLTPDWMPGAVPRCVPVDIKRNRHGDRATSEVVGTERVLIKGKWRSVEVRACPVRFSDDDLDALLREGRLNNRGRAVASRSKTGRGRTTVPVFLLVPQVRLPKRLDLARDAQAAQEALPGAIVANWVEGKTR